MSRAPRPASSAHPRLYEIDARSWLARLSAWHGRRIRLADVPDMDLAPILEAGFDYVWLMGAWTIGPAGRRIARSLPSVQAARRELLAGGSDADIVGSPFAVAGYQIAPGLGGEEGLAVLRQRLARAGVGLVLDFVPNHTATDHAWVRRYPERYVTGDASHRAADPDGYFEVLARGRRWLAHGRDPNFPPWTDTAQLDYRRHDVHLAMTRLLREIATRCDGVRCDMAMLVIDDVFRATWTTRALPPAGGVAPLGEFWWHAINAIRQDYPGFLFVAEAYWGLEWRLQQLGFDFTYDKTLLDRLARGDGPGVAAHLRAEDAYQRRSVRFLENHDEPRAAAVFGLSRERIAAVVAATVPGMLLIHDGQIEGARLRTPVQLGRRPVEPVDQALRDFYRALLRATGDDAFRRGQVTRIEPLPAWPENRSHESFVVRLWVGPRNALRLAVANLSDGPGQCFVPLALPGFAGRSLVFKDLLGAARYVRNGEELSSRGLYLDVPGWGYHLFRIGLGRRRLSR